MMNDTSEKKPANIEERQKAQKSLILDYLGHTPFYKWAAAYSGISKDTLEDWRKADPDFSAKCEAKRAEAIQNLARRATPDLIIKSADPKTFKERVDLTSGDKPIPILDINVSKDDGNK